MSTNNDVFWTSNFMKNNTTLEIKMRKETCMYNQTNYTEKVVDVLWKTEINREWERIMNSAFDVSVWLSIVWYGSFEWNLLYREQVQCIYMHSFPCSILWIIYVSIMFPTSNPLIFSTQRYIYSTISFWWFHIRCLCVFWFYLSYFHLLKYFTWCNSISSSSEVAKKFFTKILC